MIRRSVRGTLSAIAFLALTTGVGNLASAQMSEDSAGADPAYSAWVGTNQGLGDLSVDSGYSTLGVLVGSPLGGETLDDGFLFLDLRGHMENDGSYGFNSHLGVRWLDQGADAAGAPDDWVYGLNAGFDGREVKGDWYYWCRLGAEALGDDWRFRANGYIDCGNDRELALEAVGFEGNALLIEDLVRRAMWGADVSAQAAIALADDWALDATATVYHFDGDGMKAATGGRLGLETALTDTVVVGARASWDTLFDISALASVSLRLGAAPPDAGVRASVRERFIAPVGRQELVVVSEQQINRRPFRAAGEGGGRGEIVPFFHVDNTNSGAGDGSFENPWNAVALADGTKTVNTASGDVIVVHEGDGTTFNYDEGITLLDDQILLGAGFSGGIEIGGREVWYLADKVGLDGKPTLTNPDGNVITLADRNTVAYLRIVDAGSALDTSQQILGLGNGIFGGTADPAEPTPISDVTLIDNWVFDSVGSGIFINGFSGTADIRQNGVFRNQGRNQTEIDQRPDGGGIHVLSAEGRVLLEDNICGDFESGGNGQGAPRPNTTDCTEVTSNATGDLFALIRGNSIQNNIGDGVELHHTGSGTYTAVVEHNIITDNSESAVISSHDIDGTGAFDLTIRDNDLSRNGFSGIEVFKGLNSGPFSAMIDGNLIDGSGTMADFLFREAGVQFDIRSNVATVVFTNNTVTNSVGPGVFGSVGPQSNEPGDPPQPDAHLRIRIADNVITGNGFGRSDDFVGGILLWPTSADTDFTGASVPDRIGRIDAAIENNVIDGNNGFGISGRTTLALVSNTPPPPDSILCTRIVGNTGADDHLLSQNGGISFNPPVFSFPGGGVFINDLATGGNTGAINTMGTITPGVCDVP